MNLIHLANTHSVNIGNGALIEGLEKILREDCPRLPTIQREAWDDYTFGKKHFDQHFVDQINASAGLLVGAAVAINGRHYLQQAGMRLDLPYPLWREFTKPIIFYGISYRHWQQQPFFNKDKLLQALTYILQNNNFLFSVRNDGTREWLMNLLGISGDAIYEVPDPAVFVEPLLEQQYPEIRKNHLNVMLAFNNEDENFRFPGNTREQFLRQLAQVIEQLAKTTALNLILVPHYLDDYKMIYDFFTYLSPQVAHQCVRTTGLVGVSDTSWFYGRYRQADLVLSMRVHAMSPCIGMNVPTIPLVSQDRMAVFLKKVGLQTQAVDVFSHQVVDELSEKINIILHDASGWCQQQQRAVDLMRGQAKNFHQKISALLRLDHCLVS